MVWKISFFDGVKEDIVALPVKLRARMIRLLDMIEVHGANLGSPHTEPMGNGLFEIRAKAQEGIARGFFCYMDGKHIYVLHVFVKKTEKTPKKEMDIAIERMKEVKK